MMRPRPRGLFGRNPLLKNRPMAGSEKKGAGVVPGKMAQGAGVARKASLQARQKAAGSMKRGMP